MTLAFVQIIFAEVEVTNQFCRPNHLPNFKGPRGGYGAAGRWSEDECRNYCIYNKYDDSDCQWIPAIRDYKCACRRWTKIKSDNIFCGPNDNQNKCNEFSQILIIKRLFENKDFQVHVQFTSAFLINDFAFEPSMNHFHCIAWLMNFIATSFIYSA